MLIRVLLLCLALAFPAVASPKNLRWSSQGDATTLDPHSQNETFTNNINNLVYEYLATRGKDMRFRPTLATSWKNTGPTTWVFTLRKGVKFHDGTPFTADDVIFSYERAKADGSDMKAYVGSVK